jgi:hypothetical protein
MELLTDMEWDKDVTDPFIRKTYRILYRMDELGRVADEIDTDIENTITHYVYRGDKLIEKKSSYLLDDGKKKQWLFFYAGDFLERIETYHGDRLDNTEYFDDQGLLKFTREVSKPGHDEDTIFHSYIYYKRSELKLH